jgi:hypothetical protein
MNFVLFVSNSVSTKYNNLMPKGLKQLTKEDPLKLLGRK